jgi:putative ABC transport system ATP-binding protein
VLSPQKGVVELNGTILNEKNQNERDRWRAVHIGYIFQSLNLIPYLSVRENIQLPCLLSPERKAKVFSKYKDLESATFDLAQKLGIETLLQKPVRNLSVGQQQRVAVARALIGNPEIILADEPTSALDMDHREKFLSLLFDLCAELQITVVFVSHDRSIQNLFDRVVSLESLKGANV